MKKYIQIILLLFCVFLAGNIYAQSRQTAAQSRLASRQPKRDHSAFYRKAGAMRQRSIQDKERSQREQLEAERINGQQKKD